MIKALKFGKNKTVKTPKKSSSLILILSKISGAFMLPISVMAISGLFLGVGATIASQAAEKSALETFGIFIKALGDPIFALMPLFFAIAFVIAFTNEAGVGAFAATIGYATFLAIQNVFIVPITPQNSKVIIGYNILFEGAGRDPKSLINSVGTSMGIVSLNTSIFGGITVGLVVSYLYNRFHSIQLPQVISFFGGKRFVSIITIVAMIPLAFMYLIFWPWIGIGLNKFGVYLSKTPYGFDSLIFGFIERSLIPFGLHHAFYSPLWYTSVGGSVNDSLEIFVKNGGEILNKVGQISFVEYIAQNKDKWVGDSKIGNEVISLAFNDIEFTLKDTGTKIHKLPIFTFFDQQLGLKIGRFTAGKYPFMQLGLPAAAMAMIFAAPKENRKVAMGTVFPSALTSLVTGVTEPIEFTFLFLSPLLYYLFHCTMAALSFMLMNLLNAHIAQSFSGGLLDMIIYGMIPVLKGTEFWWAYVVGLIYMPIYFAGFSFAIKKWNLPTPGRGGNNKLFSKADFREKNNAKNTSDVPDNVGKMVSALGGWDNIVSYNNCASRLRYDVVDANIIDTELVKAAGAINVMKVNEQHIQVIVGPIAEQLNANIIKNKGKDISWWMNQTTSTADDKQLDTTKTVVANTNSTTSVVVKAPVEGIVKPISAVNDGVFSAKMLGDGVVVVLDKNAQTATITAPVEGEINATFDESKHAYGITTKEGLSLLIHIGIDTVNLKGEGFTTFVKQGDKVKVGDVLAKVDIKQIIDKVPSIDPIIVVLEESTIKNIVDFEEKSVAMGDNIFTVK